MSKFYLLIFIVLACSISHLDGKRRGTFHRSTLSSPRWLPLSDQLPPRHPSTISAISASRALVLVWIPTVNVLAAVLSDAFAKNNTCRSIKPIAVSWLETAIESVGCIDHFSAGDQCFDGLCLYIVYWTWWDLFGWECRWSDGSLFLSDGEWPLQRTHDTCNNTTYPTLEKEVILEKHEKRNHRRTSI